MQLVRSWPYSIAVGVSLLVGLAAVIGSQSLGIPLKDPEGFLGPAYVRLPVLAILLAGIGVLIAAIRRRGFKEIKVGVVEVIRHEWDLRRALYIMTGLATFYVSYVGYRNLKSVLPVYREGTLYDRELLEIDRWFFGGVDPGVVLHTVLGTDVAAVVLSGVYLAYLPLIPVTLGVFLVLSRDVRVGAWYATTLCLNWVLGVVSYYILPSVGPIYSRPDLYADLPTTGVTGLQQGLLNNRLEFLTSPSTSDAIHGIAAFASLHVSVTFAAALFLHYTVRSRILRYAGWAFFGLTSLATIYFGWHYVLDNIAGMAIGWAAVAIGARASGIPPEERKRLRKSPVLGVDAPDDEVEAEPETVGSAAARH